MNAQGKEVRETTLSPTLFCLTCGSTYLSETGRVEGSVCNAPFPLLKCGAGHTVIQYDGDSVKAGTTCLRQLSQPGYRLCPDKLQKDPEDGHCPGILTVKFFGSGVSRNDV